MDNKSATILIVDDIRENIRVLGNILKTEHYKVYATDRGQQAIKIANERDVDLILLDIVMPEMDGYDVINTLKQSDKTKNIPVIFITAKAETDDIVKGLQLGAVDYIPKPIRKEEVLARVYTHIELKKYRDHLEELVKERTEKLELANEVKTRFLLNIHHELKTPMNGIIGMNALLQDTQLDFEQEEYVEIINNCANGQLALIDDVLQFVEAEYGELTLEETELNIRTIIRQINSVLIVRAREKNVSISYTIEDVVPEDLIGDPGRLRQILLNIIGNAVKFTDNGQVNVVVNANETAGENYIEIVFEVTDTGIGIPPDKLDILFKPFTQIDDSLTRKYGGLGLGLVNAKQLLELMNGSIAVTSEVGKGSVFTFNMLFKKQ